MRGHKQLQDKGSIMIEAIDQQMTNNMAEAKRSARTGSTGAAIVRITLGVIVLATWWTNLTGDIYTADGLRGFFNWLSLSAEEGGNGGTLGFVHSFLDSVIGPVAGPFGIVQGILEFALGVALLLGVATRAASLAALGFFASIFLAYFGGHEWIWTYVLLMAGSLAVFIDYGGRTFGIDKLIVAKNGEPRRSLLW